MDEKDPRHVQKHRTQRARVHRRNLWIWKRLRFEGETTSEPMLRGYPFKDWTERTLFPTYPNLQKRFECDQPGIHKKHWSTIRRPRATILEPLEHASLHFLKK